MVCIHELNYDSKKIKILNDPAEELKIVITGDTIPLHLKNKSEIEIPNQTNYLAFTNFENPLKLTQDERRFCCIKILCDPQPIEYYKTLITWCKKNKRKTLGYFLNRNLEHFLQHECPQTEYTREVIQGTTEWPENLLHEGLNDETSIFNKYKIVTWDVIRNFLIDNSSGSDLDFLQDIEYFNAKKSRMLRNLLGQMGFICLKDQIRINEKRHYLFIVPEHAKTNMHKKTITRERKRLTYYYARQKNKNWE